MSITKIASFLREVQDVTILTHINPDGDALGSSFAMCAALEGMGKRAKVVLPEPLPDHFAFMDWQPVLYEESMAVQTVVALDCGDSNRLGATEALLERAESVVLLDHHKTGNPFGDLHFVDPARGATGEILFELLDELQVPLTPEIASALYVAISTDTGGFRYSNTTPRTHQIIAKLLEVPFDAARINRFLYDYVPYTKLKLTALALESLEFFHQGKIGVIAVSMDMLRQSGATYADTDGLTDYTRDVQGVEIGILLKEKGPEEIKISLRSNEYADVSAVALEFSGGGHARASACIIHAPLAQAKEQIVAAAAKILKG